MVNPPDFGRTSVAVPNWSFCVGWSSTATPVTTWAGAVAGVLLGSRATLAAAAAISLAASSLTGRETTVKDAFTAPLEVTGAVLLSVWLGAGFGELWAVDSDSFGKGMSFTAWEEFLTTDETAFSPPSLRTAGRIAIIRRVGTTARMSRCLALCTTPPVSPRNKKPTISGRFHY